MYLYKELKQEIFKNTDTIRVKAIQDHLKLRSLYLPTGFSISLSI